MTFGNDPLVKLQIAAMLNRKTDFANSHLSHFLNDVSEIILQYVNSGKKFEVLTIVANSYENSISITAKIGKVSHSIRTLPISYESALIDIFRKAKDIINTQLSDFYIAQLEEPNKITVKFK